MIRFSALISGLSTWNVLSVTQRILPPRKIASEVKIWSFVWPATCHTYSSSYLLKQEIQLKLVSRSPLPLWRPSSLALPASTAVCYGWLGIKLVFFDKMEEFCPSHSTKRWGRKVLLRSCFALGFGLLLWCADRCSRIKHSQGWENFTEILEVGEERICMAGSRSKSPIQRLKFSACHWMNGAIFDQRRLIRLFFFPAQPVKGWLILPALALALATRLNLHGKKSYLAAS